LEFIKRNPDVKPTVILIAKRLGISRQLAYYYKKKQLYYE